MMLNRTQRLFATLTTKNNIMLKQATLSAHSAILKNSEFLFGDFVSVFWAKINIKATKTVTDNFTKIKPQMFELTKPDNNGLSSLVQQYRDPITVVKQSMEPIKIRNKVGITCRLRKTFFSFSFQNRFSRRVTDALPKFSFSGNVSCSSTEVLQLVSSIKIKW